MTAAAVIDALGGKRGMAPCPVPTHGRGRGDKHPSLSITDGDDGKLLWHCFAGCDAEDVRLALADRGLLPSRNGHYFTSPAPRPAVHDEARAMTDERDDAEREAINELLPDDTPESVKLAVLSIVRDSARPAPTIRGLTILADDEDWKALDAPIKAAVARAVGAVGQPVVESIIGRWDSRSLTWREPRRPDATPEDAPLVKSGAELVAGVDPTEGAVEIAPGLAYRERTVLVHAQRGAGKSTLAAWLVSRATVDGRRVLLVGDDDPATWRSRMVQFGAKHVRWDYGEASTLARPGALERAVAEGGYDWLIVDNWRTWGVASGVPDRGGFGNTEAVAVPIERIVTVSRGGPAVTLLSNEGYHDDTRSRDSSVVEDAVDATRKVVTDELARITTLRPSQKTRTGIDRQTRRWRLRDDESGMDPMTDDGPAPEPVRDPLGPLSDFARKWIDDNPDGSLRKFLSAARGAGLGCQEARMRDVYRAAKETAESRCGPTPVPLSPDTPDTVCPEGVADRVAVDRTRRPHPCPEGVADPIGDTPAGHTLGSVAGTRSADTPDATSKGDTMMPEINIMSDAKPPRPEDRLCVLSTPIVPGLDVDGPVTMQWLADLDAVKLGPLHVHTPGGLDAAGWPRWARFELRDEDGRPVVSLDRNARLALFGLMKHPGCVGGVGIHAGRRQGGVHASRRGCALWPRGRASAGDERRRQRVVRVRGARDPRRVISEGAS